MVKYDLAFKLKVVEAYFAGEGGYSFLAKRFGVPSKENIRKWINNYTKFGKNGLIRKKYHATYPVQFKIDVINYKLRTGDSLPNIALKFDISEPSVIHGWLKIWQTVGIEGLSKPKGRPSMSNKPKRKNAEKKLTREQQLEKEITLLRAENAYLKKLRASGINIPNRLRK